MEARLLDGKVAIITGASYGMGRSMAELFAEEGASVVITARHQEKLDEVVDAIKAKGGKAVGVVADVCSTADTKKVFGTALDTFGDVDILINNAGIGEQKMIDETDDEWMKYVMDTNLGGPMRYIREALKIFLPKNDGVIINISSVNGTRPFCGATYTSTKGALAQRSHRPIWPIKQGNSLAGQRCWNTASTLSIFLVLNAIRWIRLTHVCFWQARWAKR